MLNWMIDRNIERILKNVLCNHSGWYKEAILSACLTPPENIKEAVNEIKSRLYDKIHENVQEVMSKSLPNAYAKYRLALAHPPLCGNSPDENNRHIIADEYRLLYYSNTGKVAKGKRVKVVNKPSIQATY